MSYEKLSIIYNDLQERVLDALRKEILKSKYESKFINEKAIKVNVFDYTELAIIHDELYFMDSDGLQYGIWSECSLEDLIDILRKL